MFGCGYGPGAGLVFGGIYFQKCWFGPVDSDDVYNVTTLDCDVFISSADNLGGTLELGVSSH